MMNLEKELVEGIIQELIKFLCEEQSIALEKALDLVYNSVTFEKLSDNETGLYKESASYVYELLIDEIKDGAFIQKEQ